MDKSNTLDLISQTYQADDIGQLIPSETVRQVFCSVSSVSRAEFYEAGRAGLKAAFQVIVPACDYNGEEECILDGVRYSIYRTYLRKGEDLELYLERRAGRIG